MSSLPSRSPTRCAVATGLSASPRSAPRAVWRTGWSRPAATSWRSSRRCRSRASPAPTCGGHPAGCVRRSVRRPRSCATTTRTCSSASAATSRVRPTSPPAGSACRSSCTRQTRDPAGPTAWVRASPAMSRPAFPGTPIRHGQYVGLPIRRSIATLDRTARRPEARAAYGLDEDRPTLLVTGGSQGARRLNEAASGAASALAAAGIQVLHACGPHNVVEVETEPGAPPYVVVPYLDRMDLAYAAADLALCRAGANTVSEMAAVGLPAAYVPLPIGNGEQELIAGPVVAAGGGLMVTDAACTPTWVRDTLTPLLTDPDRLATMGGAAARFGRPRCRRTPGRPGPGHRVVVEGSRTIVSAVPAPANTVPAEELGQVHFVGIGGAGMSGIARILLARGVRGLRQRRQGLGRAHRVARTRRDDPRRPRRRQPRQGRDGCGVQRDPTRQPRADGRARAGAARAAAGGGAGLGDGGPASGRRRGHPRQDDDHVAADGRPPALRCRSVVRDRRAPQRVGGQRAQRVGRHVRRRGGRERRLVPHLRAVRGDRDQRRAGPPRPLRHRRGGRGRVRRIQQAGAHRPASSSSARTTTERAGSPGRPATAASPSTPTARARTPTSGSPTCR